MAWAGANVWLGSAHLWYSHSGYVAPTIGINPTGELQEWWRATNQARELERGGGEEWREGWREGWGEGDTWKPRLYTPACVYQSWHFAWKSISTVRCCHIVRAILHASPGYSLSGMYLAPATGPCYTTCAIRDGRSFRLSIHASRYRASPSASLSAPPLILSENLRHCDQSEMFTLQMKEVFFFQGSIYAECLIRLLQKWRNTIFSRVVKKF